MLWSIFVLLSLAVLLIGTGTTLILAFRRKRLKLSPIHLLLISVFVADFLLIFPVYHSALLSGTSVWQALFMTAHDTIQIFTVNGDTAFLRDNAEAINTVIRPIFIGYGAFLYVFSPILTVGFLLSFFRNISSYIRYVFCYFSNVYVFSDMDKRAWVLAKSIAENDKRAAIVIAGRDDPNWDDEARSINAIYFSKEITDLKLLFHSKKHSVSYLLMQEDPSKNLSDALSLTEQLRKKRSKQKKGKTPQNAQKPTLYVFSPLPEHEPLISSFDNTFCSVRIVNTVSSVIYKFLFEKGREIIESAETAEDGTRMIRVGIVGLGQYGVELAKALPWFCQIDRCQLQIHIFEKDKARISQFKAAYPSLIDQSQNKYITLPSDPQYEFHFYPCSADSQEFCQIVSKDVAFTYFFVLTGDDDANIRVSLKTRQYCSRCHQQPIIRTRIYNTYFIDLVSNANTYTHNKYNIDTIANLAETYSYNTIIKNRMIDSALQQHLQWGNIDSFWKYDDNRVSGYYKIISLKLLVFSISHSKIRFINLPPMPAITRLSASPA